MRQILHLVCGLILLIISANLNAQERSEKIITRNGLAIELKTPDPKDGKPIHRFIVESPFGSVDTVSERRLLVKFKSQPLAKSSTANSSARSRSLEQDHAQFLRDLQQLQRTTSARGSKSKSASVLTEYKHVFNGYSIIASPDMEVEIRQLSYVASVIEDKKVQIIDQASNEVIRADKVWSELNITGRGVVIGIIDTGIDYTHPDLGGAIGASNKVIGGYDFVNEDNDPMDDHGHGTHVAGIAAANGAIKGVAPDAKLVAFKVLTEEGWGYDSWIMAAIERTVDPDQNPSTNDALDVVNMSLGRAPAADDPYSEAIANATAMGVTFVVAAGNNSDYFSVGTPGVAEDAITVGATDLLDVAADFSSRGPTEFTYRIKPDVSAPGVAINSTFPQNQYKQLRGTSMASPHVAGAVALLLEKNPSWTPEIIKSALMNNSKGGLQSYWVQGAGRIDVLKSIEPKFVVSPGSLSLGLYDESEEVEKVFKAVIHNTSSEVKNFSISATGEIINAHVSATIQPSVTSINPGQSKEVTVTFKTTPGLTTKPVSEGYFGELVVSSGDDIVKVPVAMVSMKETKFIFSTPLPHMVLVMGLNELGFFKAIIPKTPEIVLPLPSGTLEVVTLYNNNTIVIREAIDGDAGGDVTLTQNLAKNRIVFGFKDIDNNLIDINPSNHTGAALFSTQKLLSMYLFPQDTFYISDNSVAMFDFIARDMFGDMYYDLGAGSGAGQHESMDILKKADAKFKINIGNTSEHWWRYYSTGFQPGRGGLSFHNINPIQVPSNGIEIYAAPRTSSDNFAYSKAFITDGENAMETGSFALYQNDLVKFSEVQWFPTSTTALYTSKTFEYTLGASLLRWNGMMFNDNGRIALYDNEAIGLFNYALNERKRGEIDYELKSNDQIIATGKILNRTFMNPPIGDIWSTEAVEGAYSLSLTSTDLRIGDNQDSAHVTMEFDTRREDSNPPLLRSFSLEYDGRTTNTLKYAEHATFRIAVADCRPGYCIPTTSGVASVKLFIKSDEAAWQELELIKLHEDTLVADILEPLAQGYYSTKVIVVDFAGNTLTYTLSQAFFISPPDASPEAKLTLLEPVNHSQDVQPSPVFKWVGVADVLSYTFQVSKQSTFATLEATVTQTENELILPDLLDYNSSYYWRVKPNYETGSGPWSDIFDFRVPDFQLKLFEPANQSLQSNMAFLHYAWEGIDDAAWYSIEVSTDPGFNSLEYQFSLIDSVYHSPYFPVANTIYYWRVRPYYNAGYYGAWSEIFSFTGEVMLPKIYLMEPFDNSFVFTRQPVLRWNKVSVGESYTVQISQSVDFSIVEAEYVTVSDLDPLPEVLAVAGTYYWRARVNYQNETGPWSDVSKFTIDDFKLTLLGPANNTLQSSTYYIAFAWEDVDAVSWYNFQLSRDSQFGSLEHDEVSTVSTWNYPSFPEVNIVYYWRVRPYYELGYFGGWSEVFSFTGQYQPLILTKPLHQSVLSGSDFDFEWASLNNVTSYNFQLSKDPEFNSVEDESEVTELLYHYSQSLESNSTYYWRVRPYYNLAYYGDWSSPFSFTTSTITGLVEQAGDRKKPIAYPNPFIEGTTIKFYTTTAAEISFEISTLQGQSVDSFKKFFPLAGKQSVDWKKNDLAPGVYLCKILSADKTETVKLIRQK